MGQQLFSLYNIVEKTHLSVSLAVSTLLDNSRSFARVSPMQTVVTADQTQQEDQAAVSRG